jgi:hypothetical protein
MKMPSWAANPTSIMRRTATGTVSMAAAETTRATEAASTMPRWRRRYGRKASSEGSCARLSGKAPAFGSASGKGAALD